MEYASERDAIISYLLPNSTAMKHSKKNCMNKGYTYFGVATYIFLFQSFNVVELGNLKYLIISGAAVLVSLSMFNGISANIHYLMQKLPLLENGRYNLTHSRRHK